MIKLEFNMGVLPRVLKWNIFDTDVTNEKLLCLLASFVQLQMNTLVEEKDLCALLAHLGKAHLVWFGLVYFRLITAHHLHLSYGE